VTVPEPRDPHECACQSPHPRRRVVLTGGPGAGKTAVLELVRASFCHHVRVLPESAGIVYGGGFPRHRHGEARRAAQRAIFYVQRELEHAERGLGAAVELCDRGTVDALAYWPGPADFWAEVGTTYPDQLARYDAVIHLRVPGADGGYDHSNPLRIETADEARAIDERIARAWADHPRRFEVPATESFLDKATRALDLLRAEVPACCTRHLPITAPTAS
jgi:predicted ATPase